MDDILKYGRHWSLIYIKAHYRPWVYVATMQSGLTSLKFGGCPTWIVASMAGRFRDVGKGFD